MIEIKHLTKRFNGHCAVDDLCLQVQPGEIFGILGPNGSGKTTTLKCVAGLVSPTAGQVLLDGLDTWENAVAAKRRCVYLPQRVAFPEVLTAREILEFYCHLRRLPVERATQVLANSRFNGFGGKPVKEFSGGMVQRLGIALLALADVPVLLLDEPTTGLDPEANARLGELLMAKRAEGKTVLLTSHILSDVEELADRVAILVQGRLVKVESVVSLRQHLMAASRILVSLVNARQEFVAVARRAGASAAELVGSRLQITSKVEDRLVILQALEAAGAQIERFSTEEPSLEEIYLRYVYENDAPAHLADDRMPVRDASARVH